MLAGGSLVSAGVAQAAPATTSPNVMISSTGLTAGQVKHVWLIILENKSYDATFTGLNQNSYLWKTLPSQGALLTNYYGTGHYSMDNYLTLVSGQGPQQDTQSDCSVANTNFGTNANILTSGANAGQLSSPAGANAANGQNGCTYPTDIATLFNQLDAAGVSWKGYAQDLYNQAGREDAVCGAPGASTNNPTTNPLTMAPNASQQAAGIVSFTGAQPNDQYVAKHFPFAWFSSMTGVTGSNGTNTGQLTSPSGGGTDCDANHIANLDNAANGLYHDLQSEATTPAFSWITPDNCNDAHDAVCQGNNMSGAFDSNGQPVYGTGTPDPQSTTPLNYTGGLYAADLFLEYYIPMIEQSAAFKDGGLIDITFDESNPPFTYSGNSFNNADAYAPLATVQANAAMGLMVDAAGENINGVNVSTEPTGPNATLGTDAAGNQLYPGPGDNAFINRPPACTQTTPTLVPANCVPGIVLGGSGSTPGARTDTVTGSAGSATVTDGAIISTDKGRIVTDTVDATGPGGSSPIPDNTFVGTVTNTGPLYPATNKGPVVTGAFQLVDSTGKAVQATGAVTSITLSAEGPTADLANGITADPLYNAKDATPGGGDTGSVLISPLIKPGTVSSTFYDHYSWLRTMEDIFQVSKGTNYTTLFSGNFSSVIGTSNTNTKATVSGGLDGLGHLGFAAQAGLKPFGPDVFTNAAVSVPTAPTTAPTAAPTSGSTTSPEVTVTTGGTVVSSTPWIPEAIAGLAILLLVGGVLIATRFARTSDSRRG
jgi:hypothetical protein